MRNYYPLLFLLIIGLFSSSIGRSQDLGPETNPFPMLKVDHSSTPWYLEMVSESPNAIDAEVAFDAYFNANPQETSHQKRMFIRWVRKCQIEYGC